MKRRHRSFQLEIDRERLSLSCEIRITLSAYIAAFEERDADALVEFYHLPSLFLTPQAVVSIGDAASARQLAEGLIAQAGATGYHRTVTQALEVRRLSSELAVLSGIFSRRNVEDDEIGRFGFAYTMRRVENKWKIVVAVAHVAE